VIDNVAFGLKRQGKPRDERKARATKDLKLLGLEQFEKRAVYELGQPWKLPIARGAGAPFGLTRTPPPLVSLRGESFAWAPALRNAAGNAGR
jgi:taurine transport system ATP-binding protein